MAASSPTTPWVVKIPPPAWMLAMLLAAYGLQRSLAWAGAVYFQSVPLAAVLVIGGIAMGIWGARGLMVAGTELNPASATNRVLVVRGAFRFTRNPMYLGLMLVSLGIAFYTGTLPFYLVPVLLFLLCNGIVIPFEEEKMRRQFNDQYTDHLERVRRWL